MQTHRYAGSLLGRQGGGGGSGLRQRQRTGGTNQVVTVPAPVDVAWTSQNYHDVNNVPDIDLLAFNKSIFDRKGEVVGRFSPDVTADDPRLVSAIDAELAR